MAQPGIFNFKKDTVGDSIIGKSFGPITKDAAAVDLSNVAIKMQVRDTAGNLLVELEKGSGLTVSGVDNNVLSVDGFIVTKRVGEVNYDIEFTFPGGIVKTWIKGIVELNLDTTHNG